MAKIEVRPVRDEDFAELATNMRPQDVDECHAMGVTDLEQGLRACHRVSMLSWTATVDGQVACVFGVGSLSCLTGEGSPWLLGTNLIDKNAGAFIRRTMPYIRRMLLAFPHLTNYVDARNTRSVTWLRRVGFTLHPAAPYGPHGVPFHRFEMGA